MHWWDVIRVMRFTRRVSVHIVESESRGSGGGCQGGRARVRRTSHLWIKGLEVDTLFLCASQG